MLKFPPRLRRWLSGLTSSIAFYPTMMALVAVIAALLMLPFEFTEPALALREYLGMFVVENPDDARSLIATLVGSVISLMVFSFSMVMVVLNRATTTLTPRVVPGLISDKANQMVLGTYLATILFSLVLFLNIQAPSADHRVPGLGLLVATLLSLVSLGMFAVFIHRVSRAIKVDSILDTIYRAACHQLKASAKRSCPSPTVIHWHPHGFYKAPTGGYLRQVDYGNLAQACAQHDCQVHILKPVDGFCLEGEPLLAFSRELPDAVRQELGNSLLVMVGAGVGQHFRRGFEQITEIAVKALSPSVADPGTAIAALDLLGALLQARASLPVSDWGADRAGVPRVCQAEPDFKSLLYEGLGRIRAYGGGDLQVLIALLRVVAQLAERVPTHHWPALEAMARSIRARAEGCQDRLDRIELNSMIDYCNRALPRAALEKLPGGQ